MKRLLILAILLLPCCSTGELETARVASRLETMRTAAHTGLNYVVPGELDLYACGEAHKIGREFTAVNAKGETVQGIVCCGTQKTCTVRF